MAPRRLSSAWSGVSLGAMVWLAVSAPAAAQTVYRCGPAGNSYSQQPCADGRAVDVSDPRSAAQVAEARASLRAQEQWATRAARERRIDEAARRPAQAVSLGPPPPPAEPPRPTKKPPKRSARGQAPAMKPAREGEFAAISPPPPRPRPSQR